VRVKVCGVLLVTASLLAVSAPLGAHHGAASFDTERELTLEGAVTEWVWSNPHCFLKFDVTDESGTVTNWVTEVQNPIDMTTRGWARTSFRAGDVVTVVLQPVKSGAPVGRIRSVLLPNGQTLNARGPAPDSRPAQPGR
jgi:hypothetical protein